VSYELQKSYMFPPSAAAAGGTALSHRVLCPDLATLEAVEDYPHGEVLGKVLETMLSSGSDEQKVAGLKWVPFSVMKENASAGHDDVNLVLLVGSSWARKRCEASERKHGVQGSTPQKTDRMFTCGTRDTRLSLGKMDHTATVGRVHV
jgi:hypothetical protein